MTAVALGWDEEFQRFLDEEDELYCERRMFEELDRYFDRRLPQLGDDADGEGWT